jgi:hypothetical protein
MRSKRGSFQRARPGLTSTHHGKREIWEKLATPVDAPEQGELLGRRLLGPESAAA